LARGAGDGNSDWWFHTAASPFSYYLIRTNLKIIDIAVTRKAFVVIPENAQHLSGIHSMYGADKFRAASVILSTRGIPHILWVVPPEPAPE
jgi:hypothetical protein